MKLLALFEPRFPVHTRHPRGHLGLSHAGGPIESAR
jgi:hypothetical protein